MVERKPANVRSHLTAIIIFLFFALLTWAGLSAMPKADVVRVSETGGNHDLRNFDFENYIAIIDKDTMWEIYPEKLYGPEDFTAGAAPPLTRDSSVRLDYATFRLRLLLIPGQTYGYSLRSADFTMRIYIDGEEVDSVGVPATTRENSTPRTDYRIYYFTPDDAQTDIILQVSNFVHRKDASIHDSYFGLYKNIDRQQQIELLITFAIFGSLLTSALYHLAVFLVNRRRVTELVFSVCCFSLMLMTQRIIFMFFPNYNWFVVIRVEYIVHYTTFAMVIYFMYRLFPKLLHKRLVMGYLVISGALILLSVLADMTVSSHIIRFYDAASVVLALWVLIRLAMSLRRGRLQNLLGFTGMLVLTLFAVNDMIGRYTALNTPFQYNLSFTAPVGMVFFMLCYAMALALDYAETEQRAMETEAETVALNRVNTLKTELMRTISHETRTPLAVIMGFAQITARDARKNGLEERISVNLDAIAAEAKRLADMMEEMRQFALAKEYSKDCRAIDAGEVIGKVARLYIKILESKNIKFTANIEDDLPLVYGSANELTQVIFNLLRNADTHTEGGEIAIHAQVAGGHVKVAVSDTGTGIAPELLPRVFERGVYGEGGGDGYGLAICKDIITAYGGEIYIESGGDGTTAVFTLPAYPETEGGAPDG